MRLEHVRSRDSGVTFEHGDGVLRLLGNKSLVDDLLNNQEDVNFFQKILEFRLSNSELAKISASPGQGKCTFAAALLNKELKSLYGQRLSCSTLSTKNSRIHGKLGYGHHVVSCVRLGNKKFVAIDLTAKYDMTKDSIYSSDILAIVSNDINDLKRRLMFVYDSAAWS
jgi:predicted acetyltransferase